MNSLSNLPSDIIYEVAKHLSIRDMCILLKTSISLYNKIKNLQSSIIIYNFKKQWYNNENIDNFKTLFYGCIQHHLTYYIYNYTILTYNSHRFGNCRLEYLLYQCQNMNLDDIYSRQDTFYNTPTINVTQQEISSITNNNWYVNSIFSKIFYYIAHNNQCDITQYPNKFELYALYNFLQIGVYQNKIDFTHLSSFLESIDTIKYYNVRLKYYSSILDTFHTNPITITFDKMFIMSSIIISIPIFKKLFGIKVLDLSRTRLHECCLTCNEEILREICEFKLNYQKDELVSHNYVEFKRLLQKENAYYFAYLENIENYYLNDFIYVKNPTTNKRMRINGPLYKSFIKWISLDNSYYHDKMIKNITKRREYLRTRMFT